MLPGPFSFDTKSNFSRSETASFGISNGTGSSTAFRYSLPFSPASFTANAAGIAAAVFTVTVSADGRGTARTVA